jgi:redox-sensitive bicupin YhaK (pirin superfamily)
LIAVRPSRERLRTRIGWLDSRHTFTFEEHIDPRHMGYRALRVLNEDRIAPGRGYGAHPRRDLELMTYVIAGSLRHQDSLGTDTVVAAGGLQRISAGTGILHTESNASASEPLHVIQMWIAPARTRLRPGYQSRSYPLAARRRALTLLASDDGREGSVTVHQDLAMFSCVLKASGRASLALSEERHAWVQVIRGNVELNGVPLATGDGASASNEASLELVSLSVSETVLFDLA